MSLSRRIFYNTFAQTFGKVFAALLGLVTVALLSQYLGEAGFGQYSTVVAYLGLFGVLADLGLYLYVVREISRPDTNHPKILSNALGLRLTAALITLLAASAIALFLPYDPVVKKAMFAGIGAFLFVSLNQVLVGVFQKHLVQHLLVAAETISRAVNLGLVYLFITQRLSVPYFILALLGASAVNFFFSFIFARQYERFGIGFDFGFWKKILRTTWPLVFAVILNLLYFKTDTIILSLFKSQEAVGVYSLPYKILEGLLAFPAMFVGLVMPLLSKTAFVAWGKFREIWQRSFDALLLAALLVVITFIFFSQEIINLIKGPRQYLDSPALLQILVLSAGTIFLGTLMGYAVVAVNKQKAMIKGYLLGAIAGLILYFSLIPFFSYWGAAWGTLATEIIVASYAYWLIRGASGQRLSAKILLLALPAILALAAFFSFVSLPWIVEIALGWALYITLLVVFKAIPLEFVKEIAFLK